MMRKRWQWWQSCAPLVRTLTQAAGAISHPDIVDGLAVARVSYAFSSLCANRDSPRLSQVRCFDTRIVHVSDDHQCQFSFHGQRADRLANVQSVLARPHSAIPRPLPGPAANSLVGHSTVTLQHSRHPLCPVDSRRAVLKSEGRGV